MRLHVIALCLLASGCHKAPPPMLQPVSARIAERIPTSFATKPETKRRFGEAVAYIDGKAVGVVKYSEIPAELTRKPKLLPPDFPVFPLAEYLERVGADLTRIKQVHLYGGRRVSIIDGKELLRAKDRLVFAFSQGTDGGKPRIEWPSPGVKTNTRIDTVTAIAVYQDKEPPTLHPQQYVGSFLAFEDGTPLEGIPYAPKEDVFKGTRVYVGGRLAAAVKRKSIPDAFLVEGSPVTKPQFHLVSYLESVGVSFRGAKAVDFVDGDHTIARFESTWWRDHSGQIEFSLPRRSRGRIVVHMPESAPLSAEHGNPDGARVTAIVVHDSVPPQRKIEIAERVGDDLPDGEKNVEREVQD